MTRNWRRRLLVGGAGLAAVAALAALVLATDVGAPRDRHPAAPDPCQLLPEPTVRELAGDVRPALVADIRPGLTWGLTREESVRVCWARPSTATQGTITVSVYSFHSTQFRLGRTGEQRAADQLRILNERFLDIYPDGCTYVVDSDQEAACGMYDDRSVHLNLQRDNLFVSVDLQLQAAARERAGTEWDQVLARLTDEILLRLDEATRDR